jgi:hypothetical protein
MIVLPVPLAWGRCRTNLPIHFTNPELRVCALVIQIPDQLSKISRFRLIHLPCLSRMIHYPWQIDRALHIPQDRLTIALVSSLFRKYQDHDQHRDERGNFQTTEQHG